ncbi:MAG: GntR family transcriptional regulator [Zhengella sp.]|uniref:GntR family transcriptional regulator n=1 Tax=Zhengella sp. TaxID=2282762 RepID=UPI001E169058|nr:GntR family transcriptional regulator [Notoacmeibacter sp.]
MPRTLLEEVTQNLREKVLSGTYEPGLKLREVALAEDLNASRTVIRLALGAIAQEGLVEGQPNRGFSVRAFTIDEVADAIEVRGNLEGMGARLAAERGLSDAHAAILRDILARMDALMLNGFSALASRTEWIELNSDLHDTIIAASGSSTLKPLIEHLSRIPLVSSRALVFDTIDTDRSIRQIRASHDDHHAVVEAILSRQGTRAECIMREHALRSCRNKRGSFEAMQTSHLQPEIPGIALVRVPSAKYNASRQVTKARGSSRFSV